MSSFPFRSAITAACLLFASASLTAQSAIEVRVRTVGIAVPDAAVHLLLLSDTTNTRTLMTGATGVVVYQNVPAGRYRVRVEHLGYDAFTREITATASGTVRVDAELRSGVLQLPGILVQAERRRARYEESAGATVSEMSQRDVKMLPGLAEADVLRAVEVLPGVVSTSDFSSAFNVRGGGADQNLILLDGLPIYNPFHLGGLFSVFNADMVKRVELMSGGFPAEYGGRVSSVLSIESQAAGDDTDVQAGVSILATRVAVGGDIPKSLLESAGLVNGRARLSVRRSYFDKLLKPIFDFPYHLTDFQLFSEAFSPGGARVTLSGYTGRDVLDLAGLDSFPLQVKWQWGNDVIGGSWSVPLSHGRTLETRLGFTRFNTAIVFPQFGDTEFSSNINQTLLRTDLSGRWNRSAWRTGLAADYLSYHNLAESGGTVFGDQKDRGWMVGVYAEQSRRTSKWLIDTGLRADGWMPRNGNGSVVVQPRIAVKRFFGGTDDVALKASVGRYAQFAHSLRDEELPLGIDVWVLSGDRAPVVISDQAQAGVEGFLPGRWYFAVEGYYRHFKGVVANNTAEDPNDVNDDLLRGTGLSYGADIQLRRDEGRIRPMLAVSWLKATREYDDVGIDPIDPPKLSYPPLFDRRLDVDLVIQAMLPHKWELGVRWNLGTGLPYTRPIGGYAVYDYSLLNARRHAQTNEGDSATAVVLGPRNGERYPVYHRLDAGIRRTFHRSWGTLTPSIDVLNLYDRRNVLFYFFKFDDTPATRAGVSMFPLLPTIGVEVRF